jgi:peroxiredoxin
MGQKWLAAARLVSCLTRARVRALGALTAIVSLAACGSPVQKYGAPKTPVTQISNATYEGLLAKYVGDSGRVDYARWKDNPADVQALDHYLAVLTTADPDSRPDLFKSQTDRLSYWLNLYNAVVLREIIRRWPLESITDPKVNGSSFVRSGKGFFYDLQFAVGEQRMNLYDVENRIIRTQFRDARIHFAINCGSSSCPLLRADPFDPNKLEGQLESASKTFVNDGRSVVVDDAKKEVIMSKIFAWYADDFVSFTKSRAKVKEAGVVDFVLMYADATLGSKLREAKSKSYKVVYGEYDWNVPKQTGAPPGGVAGGLWGVGKPVPDVELNLLDGSGTWRPSSVKGRVLLLDFWATFCVPCKASFPALQALHVKYKDEGLVVVGVSEDDDPKSVVPQFLTETGATFPIAVDPAGTAAESAFKVGAMPTELIVDRHGVVRHRHEGLRDGELDEIAKQIEALLKED